MGAKPESRESQGEQKERSFSGEIFSVGDTVYYWREFGTDEIFIVVDVAFIPEDQQHLTLHQQWVDIKDKNGTRYPTMSGWHLIKK